jgi:exosortase
MAIQGHQAEHCQVATIDVNQELAHKHRVGDIGTDQAQLRYRCALVIPMALLGASLLWAYWPVLCEMERHWAQDPRYSHGYLVPAFSFFLLWFRRGRLTSCCTQRSWLGLLLLATGMVLLLLGTRYYQGWVRAISLLFCLAGTSLLVGGWPMLRWAWPAIAFLVFMIPLPYRVERALGQPLQNLATVSSTYALQTLGMSALAEGNIILLSGHLRIGVAEACNGLGMLMMFFAYSTAAALVIQRPWLDRVLIVTSAIPIALAANVARIVVTAVLEATVGGEVANMVYHDLAGWLMMPLALATLWAELQLLARLFLEPLPAATLHPNVQLDRDRCI